MEAITTATATASAATARQSWWVLFLSLAGKWGNITISSLNFLSLSLLFLLVWLLISLFFWAFPGGHAWGKYWSTRGFLFRHLSTIPGPRGLPFLGSMTLMSGLAHRRLATEAKRLKAKRLMAFSTGESRCIVTSHPDVAKEMLNSSAFVDRPPKESAYKLMFHRSIGFAPYGLYWRTLRRIAVTHLFSPKQITMSEPMRFKIASEMVKEIKKSRGKVRVRDVLKLAALNNMMWLVFGKRYSPAGSDQEKGEVKELLDLVDQGYDLLGKLDWSDHLPLLSGFDLQGIRSRCNSLLPRVNRFVNNIITDRRKTGVAGDSRNFVDVLLSLQNSENLSDDDVNAVLWEMVFRGTDTVAVLMEWLIARVVLHPEVQAKAHEELDKVVGRSRPVTETDMTSLVYIQATVKETLRLHPPGPLLSWARLSTHDTVIDGHHIPAETTGMVNMWAITHDNQFWKEPLDFKPERFLLDDGDLEEEISIFGSDLRLAPFGSGRRSCPGKAVGMATVEFWTATLLHEYEWFPSEAVDLSEILRLTCEMASPLMVDVRSRRT